MFEYRLGLGTGLVDAMPTNETISCSLPFWPGHTAVFRPLKTIASAYEFDRLLFPVLPKECDFHGVVCLARMATRDGKWA
jgi:hypothetical protein